MSMYGIRDFFAMRYSLDTQTELALHNDASMVSGSVKLNDNYQGAELSFPSDSILQIDMLQEV